MEPSTFETTRYVFCPKCKKRTKFNVSFYYKKYVCEECGLSFNSKDYSKVLKEYSSKK